jgi:hypothetical protein
MADTAKKTKAAPKPRKPAVKKKTVSEMPKAAVPTREEIERLARSYWEARGYQDGDAEQDWLRAEQELYKMAS